MTSLLKNVMVAEVGARGVAVPYAGRILADLGATVRVVGAHDPALAELDAWLGAGKQVVDEIDHSTDIVLVDGDGPIDDEALERMLGGWRGGRPPIVVELSANGRDELGGELGAVARSGTSWAIGDPGREPLTLPYSIPSMCLGSNGAAAAVAALVTNSRAARVHVTTAAVLGWYTAMNSMMSRGGVPWHREGRRAAGSAGLYPYGIFDASDGEVAIIARSAREWENLLKGLGYPSWAADPRYMDQTAMGGEYPDEADALLKPLLKRHTAAELTAMGVEMGFAIARVNHVHDVISEPHFQVRGALRRDPDGILVPGSPYLLVGEDDAHDADATTEGGRNSLRGLRVLDLGWVWSAPLVSSILADLGADVIKVEHGARIDSLRVGTSTWVDGRPAAGPRAELCPTFHSVNRGKRSLALDLQSDEGREILRGLIRKSDVVIENMTVGAMSRLGFDFDTLRELNPAIVLLSMSGAGQVGPLRSMRSYAPIMSCMSGVESLVGYPGEAPIGMMTMGLGDPNAAVHAITVLMAAIHRREQTGQGVMIDFSQSDALIPLIAEAVIGHQVAGESAPRGNRSDRAAPHGIFPVVGDDEWVALSVTSDDDWKRLIACIATLNNVRPPGRRADVAFLADARFARRDDRLANAEDLESALAAVTRTFHRGVLLAALATARIDSAPVNRHSDLEDDPVIAKEGFWQQIDQPLLGRVDVARVPWMSREMSIEPAGPSPLLGEHSAEVLAGIGISDADIADLALRGVLS